MLRIGLTGGIGAGKSAVAQRMVQHGAVLVDADVLAREVVGPGTDGLREVVAAFGSGVLAPDGALDRPALGARVFGDDAARRTLERIIHPRVRARTAELIAAAPADAIVVNDVPLLVETRIAATYQMVVVVAAAEALRVERLARTRGMAAAEARARIRAQATDEQRREAADVVLANDGTLADLDAAVDALWRDRVVPYEANLRAGRPARRARVPVLAAPDPTWPVQARRLISRLAAVAGDRLIRVDHVGSTAVPGLAARDLIDIQAVVADVADADRVADAAPVAGFVRAPDRCHGAVLRGGGAGGAGDHEAGGAAGHAGGGAGGVAGGGAGGGGAGGERVAVDADPGRPVNIRIRPVTGPVWRHALLLRDWLRADPAALAEYAAVKRELAGRPGTNIDAYGRDKQTWIVAALDRAERWAAEASWTP